MIVAGFWQSITNLVLFWLVVFAVVYGGAVVIQMLKEKDHGQK